MAVMVMESVSLDVANVNRDMVEKIVAKVTQKCSGFCKISNLEILRSKFKNKKFDLPFKIRWETGMYSRDALFLLWLSFELTFD